MIPYPAEKVKQSQIRREMPKKGIRRRLAVFFQNRHFSQLTPLLLVAFTKVRIVSQIYIQQILFG